MDFDSHNNNKNIKKITVKGQILAYKRQGAFVVIPQERKDYSCIENPSPILFLTALNPRPRNLRYH